ncbi:flavin monoamine oxidase family protein [Gulosibacter chungangensis]|uniref:FAD-dependent oxidoreductase n=1 Tax=Gulosibacter chungangensis TaxID=979746 RepID=A0A7J5BFK6_9MICO|nr:NAD(P)/FAD-dependent oxidoreductase [Gulosibacter chungangensis]KAB1645053.1 FAD-dependent oxidoreductase [Gulosibacter chungangensis]
MSDINQERLDTQRFDTIIIGAGFAGLTAARDLAAEGQSVLVIEGRDRIAGRTWYEERLGMGLELGGTWVHWTQPYVWRELNHYGIGTVKSPDFQRAIWFEDGERQDGSLEELLEAMAPGCDAFGVETRKYFPRAFEPFTNPEAADLDHLSVDDVIATLELTDSQKQRLRTFWTLNFNGSTDTAAYTQALRWLAATNGDWQVMWEACATYKVEGGTKALADAIHQDALGHGAQFLFNTRVAEVVTDADRATVHTLTAEYVADRVIVTVPLQILGDISFTPALPTPINHAAARGQTGLGTKAWFKLKGHAEPFMALGEPDWPFNFLQAEYPVEDGIIVIGFGSDASAIDVTDLAQVTDAVQRIIPGAEIEATTGHDWCSDEFAGETWPMHSVGHFKESFTAFVAGTDRVRFAGADYALGWGGFIDGAIESATQQSRRILNEVVASASTERTLSEASQK